MQYCPQCGGEGGVILTLPYNGEIKEFICKLCNGEKFVTDEVHDRYMSENPKKIYVPDGEKRKLAEKFARENIKKSIEYGIKSDVRSLGKKI